MYPLTFLYTRQLLIHSNATTALSYIYIYIDTQKIRLPSQQGIMRPHHCMQMLWLFCFFSLRVRPETPPPVCLLTTWFFQPLATSVNCVSRFEGYRERLVFAEEARLALISHGVWDPHDDPRGQKVEVLSRCRTRDTNESTAAYCHHTPERQGSKLPCQELWPQGTI